MVVKGQLKQSKTADMMFLFHMVNEFDRSKQPNTDVCPALWISCKICDQPCLDCLHDQELRGVVTRLEESMNTAKDELNTTMKLIAKVSKLNQVYKIIFVFSKGRQKVNIGWARNQEQADEYAHYTGYMKEIIKCTKSVEINKQTFRNCVIFI